MTKVLRMKTDNTSLRQKWIAYWRVVYEAWKAGRHDYPTIPKELHNLRCGAKTRAGTPCRMKALYRNGRCKLHGGLSTGPKSEEGKARASQNWQRAQSNNEPLKNLTKPDYFAPQTQAIDPDSALKPAYIGVAMPEQMEVTSEVSSPTVRCIDCAHLSAGQTCILRLAGSLPMGVPRLCTYFVELQTDHW